MARPTLAYRATSLSITQRREESNTNLGLRRDVPEKQRYPILVYAMLCHFWTSRLSRTPSLSIVPPFSLLSLNLERQTSRFGLHETHPASTLQLGGPHLNGGSRHLTEPACIQLKQIDATRAGRNDDGLQRQDH